MKFHGCILEFTDERNQELIIAFRETLRRRSYIIIADVMEEVVNMPCSRFWVSEERAMVVVGAMMKGRPILCTMRPTKREMFREIYRRVLALQKDFPGKPLFELVVTVVNSPAPKFYMTPRSAMETIYKIKSGFYEHRQRRY